MPNNDYPFQNENAPSGDYPSADKTVVNNPYADSWPAGLQPDPYTSPQAATPQPSPYESPNVQDGQVASPGSTAPQHRIMQDAPTVQMRRPPTSRQNLPADQAAYGQRGQQPYPSAYDPDTYDPSPAKPERPTRKTSQQLAEPQPRRGASALRWIARILCLGLLVFGAMTVYYLTEQSVADTSALSSGAGSLAEHGAYLVQAGLIPAFEDDPIKWTAAHILLLSVKFSNHGLSVRQQAHVVEFAILGGVIALNVLAWMSGWAHRRSRRGHIRIWRTWLMYALTILACAAASFADQYHKLYVPGRHFDKLDLFLDASGYITAVTCVFIAWSIGSFVYRLIFQNKFEKKVVDAPPTSGLY
ncbi:MULTISPECIES: VanZ family protein [unclassified Collinsella]|jgi:hypothetical protein|uniref:VanZ family protein n=1 Tax=unclassified Collinsella TaxID=2637548 RepID=UPI001F35D3D2|nr:MULTISPECIES: VanZ family protein [unclassified Collinsella]